ncbi:hypothetical protein M405DRAFT_803826 [Rhizopogon salebrosus TDB-379]|nr:hypothetical protein M405DRAFT_803826 [Rhizopogon salebrosus TDB-379]
MYQATSPYASIEEADEMYDCRQCMKPTIWYVLFELRSTRIPRNYVFGLFPPLRPRVNSSYCFQGPFILSFMSSIPVKFILVLVVQS